jgi:hypothetical protein
LKALSPFLAMDNGAVGSSVSQPTIQLRGKAVHSEIVVLLQNKDIN